jgi:hypothetical protein
LLREHFPSLHNPGLARAPRPCAIRRNARRRLRCLVRFPRQPRQRSTSAAPSCPPVKRIARPPTPQLSSRFDSRATHARKLLPTALASVPFEFVVRVRVSRKASRSATEEEDYVNFCYYSVKVGIFSELKSTGPLPRLPTWLFYVYMG